MALIASQKSSPAPANDMFVNSASSITAIAGLATSYFQGAAQKEIGKMNADAAEFRAWMAQEKTEDRLSVHGKRVRQLLGQQRVALAKAGVRGGSSEDILLDSLINAEQDRVAIKTTGMMEEASWIDAAEKSRLEGSIRKSRSMERGVAGSVGTALQMGQFSDRTTKI